MDYVGKENVAIELSPVRFQGAYTQYQQCVKQLWSFGFRTIRSMDIRFSGGEPSLSTKEKEKLDRIVRYTQWGGSLENIFLKGSSDGQGGLIVAKELAKKRVALVKKYLVEQGIHANMLVEEEVMLAPQYRGWHYKSGVWRKVHVRLKRTQNKQGEK